MPRGGERPGAGRKAARPQTCAGLRNALSDGCNALNYLRKVEAECDHAWEPYGPTLVLCPKCQAVEDAPAGERHG